MVGASVNGKPDMHHLRNDRSKDTTKDKDMGTKSASPTTTVRYGWKLKVLLIPAL